MLQGSLVFDLHGRFTRELIYTYKKASAHEVYHV